MLDFKNASSSKFLILSSFFATTTVPLQPPKLSANAHFHSLTLKHTPSAIPSTKNTAQMASFFVPFLFLPPPSKHEMFVFLFSPSPILSMNNAAEMALFTCLTPLSLTLIPTRKIWPLWPHFSFLGPSLIPIPFRA